MKVGVSILGIFVADTAYLAKRMPNVGETITGTGFAVGPGGKGSNQAVAAARAGGTVSFISKIGRDTFGDLALKTYAEAGVTPKVVQMDDMPTGAAFIYVNDGNGDNAIIVYPGAAGTIGVSDVEAARETIEQSAVFVTQLEQPAEAAQRALEIAMRPALPLFSIQRRRAVSGHDLPALRLYRPKRNRGSGHRRFSARHARRRQTGWRRASRQGRESRADHPGWSRCALSYGRAIGSCSGGLVGSRHRHHRRRRRICRWLLGSALAGR